MFGCNCYARLQPEGLKHSQEILLGSIIITIQPAAAPPKTYSCLVPVLPWLSTETHILTSSLGPTTINMVMDHNTISTTPAQHTSHMTNTAMIPTQQTSTGTIPTQTHKLPVLRMYKSHSNPMSTIIQASRKRWNREFRVLKYFLKNLMNCHKPTTRFQELEEI